MCVVVFHRFALAHTRVRYTLYKVLVWLTLHEQKISWSAKCHYIRRGLNSRGRGRPLRTGILICKALGAFALSLLDLVGSSKAMGVRSLPSPPPGYLSPVAMCARVGSEHPVLPLHGATCWLGIFFTFLVNVTCNMKQD